MATQGQQRDAQLAAGARRFGWKAGLGTAAAKAAAGTDAPLVGFLTAATTVGALAGADRLAIGGWGNPRFEAEVAVRIAHDLEAGADLDAVAAAIDALAPAIEIADVGDASDVEAVLAGNIFHRAYAIGPWTPTRDARADLASARLTVEREGAAIDGGGPERDGEDALAAIDPATLLGDLVEVVAAVADQAPLAGDTLQAGDVVITGSAIPALALSGGERFVVTLDGAGSVRVAIAP